MQDGYYVVNFHEHPGDFAARNNARMGIDRLVIPLFLGEIFHIFYIFKI
jgi:hypothetical protein